MWFSTGLVSHLKCGTGKGTCALCFIQQRCHAKSLRMRALLSLHSARSIMSIVNDATPVSAPSTWAAGKPPFARKLAPYSLHCYDSSILLFNWKITSGRCHETPKIASTATCSLLHSVVAFERVACAHMLLAVQESQSCVTALI